jgi:hypothetical protein
MATGAYPALLVKNDYGVCQQKLILKASVPGILSSPKEHIAFQIFHPLDHVRFLLELTHYRVSRSTVLLPFFSPAKDKPIMQRWFCFTSERAVGWVKWNKNYCTRPWLDSPRLYCPLIPPIPCIQETPNGDMTKFPVLPVSDGMKPNSEHKISSSQMSENLLNMVEGEFPRGEKIDDDNPTSSEHDLAKQLPDDPFGMDFDQEKPIQCSNSFSILYDLEC